MESLSVEQVMAALTMTDLRFRVLPDNQGVTFGFGPDDAVGFLITVEGDTLSLHAGLKELVPASRSQLIECVNEASAVRHAPQACVADDVKGAGLRYDQCVDLPSPPTRVVAAVVHGFIRGVLSHRELVLELIRAPEAVTEALARLTDGSSDRTPRE